MHVPQMNADTMKLFLEEKKTPDYFKKYAISSVIFLEGDSEKIKILLDHGCDCDTPDMYDHTPLYYAISKNQKEIVYLLLREGAEIKENMKKVIENSSEEMKEIIYYGSHEMIKEPV